MPDRRTGAFVERVTIYVVVIAAIGAFLVLLDPKMTLTFNGQTIAFGGDGFSSELKGAVITIMLIGGWTAAIGYWLSDTATGKKQQESISRIAESAPPIQAMAVAAARAPAPTTPIVAPAADAVTPAPKNLETGNVPAAEVQPKGDSQ